MTGYIQTSYKYNIYSSPIRNKTSKKIWVLRQMFKLLEKKNQETLNFDKLLFSDKYKLIKKHVCILFPHCSGYSEDIFPTKYRN